MKPSLSRASWRTNGSTASAFYSVLPRAAWWPGIRGPIQLFKSDAHSLRRDRGPKPPTGLSHDSVNPTFDSICLLTHSTFVSVTFFPLPPDGGGFPLAAGRVKVDRPEGGDPMYAWGGTLTLSDDS